MENVITVICGVMAMMLLALMLFVWGCWAKDAIISLMGEFRYMGKKGKALKEFEDLEFCGEIILMGYRLALISKNTERAETEKENLIKQAEKIKDLGFGDKSAIVDYVAKHFE